MKVRTRVAPSPTGDPHLGTAYTALFNRAFAHRHEGSFILRLEDTDRERSTSASAQSIQEVLQWLGLTWDEGPGVEGKYGPYIASLRLDIYQEYIQQLIQLGGAFHCFCTKGRLASLRAQQQAQKQTPRYDGKCLSLRPEDVKSRLQQGEPYVIRLRVPDQGTCTIHDELRGQVSFLWKQIDMQVLLKSDGYPTYHFAAPLDDHLMKITHIFRGEEWLSSCPKHQLIFDYFGWKTPKLYHLPLLRNPDQSKISKRKQATSVNFYRRQGYLPQALLNYLALMGWSMPDEREKFSLNEFQSKFDPDRVSTSGPVFDIEKLNWLNGEYIRELSISDFKDYLFQWAFDDDRAARLLTLLHQRTERFDQVFGQADYILGERGVLSDDQFEHRHLSKDDCKKILEFTHRTLEIIQSWEREQIFQKLKCLAELLELKLRDFLFPLFLAISGRSVSLPLFDSIELIGSEVSRDRIRSALTCLGGVSKKELKRYDTEWRELSIKLVDEETRT